MTAPDRTAPSSVARETHRPLTVVAMMLALFLAALELTVVSTAMPTVVAELGGVQHYAWVFTSYMLASTVTVPLYGKLADSLGRKPILFVALALFLVGSAACGQATSMTTLVLARVLQGLGAGGVNPVVLTIIGDLYDVEERGRMQGWFGAVWAVAGLVGPLVGGLIVQHASWRWVFYLNMPFGLAAALVLAVAYHGTVERRATRIDWPGAALLVSSVLALLVAVDGTATALLLPAAIVLGLAFVWVEARAESPILPPAILANRVIATSSAVGLLAFGAMMGLVTFVPLYVQGALGRTPTEAGATIAPMAIAWPIASAVGGRFVVRLGFRRLVRVGMALSALAALGLPLAKEPATLRVLAGFFGVGMGLSNIALMLGVQSAVGMAERGVATGVTLFARSIGNAVAVGALGAMLSAGLSGVVAPSVVEKLLSREGRGSVGGELAAAGALLGDEVGKVLWAVFGLAALAFLASLAFPARIAAETKPGAGARAGG